AVEGHGQRLAVLGQDEVSLVQHPAIRLALRVPGVMAGSGEADRAVTPGLVLLAVESEVKARGAAVLVVQHLARALRVGERLAGEMALRGVEFPRAVPGAVGRSGWAGHQRQQRARGPDRLRLH